MSTRPAWALVLAIAGGWMSADAREPGPLSEPLFVGEDAPAWYSGTDSPRLAWFRDRLLVAAREGLREYDLEAPSLARPDRVPPGPATAVVADHDSAWVAVAGRLFRRTRAAWTPVAGAAADALGAVHALALDRGVLWVAADRGLFRVERGRLRPVELAAARARAHQGAVGAGMVAARDGVVWAWIWWHQAGAGGLDLHAGLARVGPGRAGGAEVFEPAGMRMVLPSALDVEPDGRMLAAFRDSQGDRPAPGGGGLYRFDGATFERLDRAPAPLGFRRVAGERWVLDREGLAVLGPDGARIAVAEPGPGVRDSTFLGACRAGGTLVVLTAGRVYLGRGGRFTMLAAPVGGVSTELVPVPGPGFLLPTGRTFGPPAGGQGVEAFRPPAEVLARGAGVTLVRGARTAPARTGPEALLPELSPPRDFVVRGVYSSREDGPALVRAHAGLDRVPLAGPLEARDGELVTAEVRPEAGADGRIRFRVGRVVTRRAMTGAVGAARDFLATGLDALRAGLEGEVGKLPLPGAEASPEPVYDDADGTVALTWVSRGFGPKLTVEVHVDAADRVVEAGLESWFLGP